MDGHWSFLYIAKCLFENFVDFCPYFSCLSCSGSGFFLLPGERTPQLYHELESSAREFKILSRCRKKDIYCKTIRGSVRSACSCSMVRVANERDRNNLITGRARLIRSNLSIRRQGSMISFEISGNAN